MYSTSRTSGSLGVGSSGGHYGSSAQYGSHGQYDGGSSRYGGGGGGGGLSSSGRYNTGSLGGHDRYGGGGGSSSYGSRLDNDRDLNYNRPDSSSSYTRESPYNKDYTARDSLHGSTPNMYGTKDRKSSTYGSNRDTRDSSDRYKTKESLGYGSRDRDLSSYNRDSLSKSTRDYDSYNNKKDSLGYNRDINGREKSRLKDDSYLSRRDSDYLDEEDSRKIAANGKGKKKKRKNPITCNLSGTRYEVGRFNFNSL